MTEIVLASGSFWPREGGAERQMRQVLSAASSNGLSCAVVTQAILGQPRRSEVDGIQVHRVGSAFLFRHAPKLGQVVFTGWQAWRVWRLRPTTAVSIQMGSSSVAVALVRRLGRMRHIVRLTGGGTANHRSEPWVRQSTLVGRLVVGVVARKGVILVSPAAHLLADFAEAFPTRPVSPTLIPNGVAYPEATRVPPDGERRGVAWYARGGATKSTTSFLGIVELSPDLPFSAFGQTGPLESAAPVRALGWVEDPYQVLTAHRVLLNTSPTEGMPNTALQALAAGMHVVGPRNEGLIELARTFPQHITFVELDEPSAAAGVLRRVHEQPLPGPAAVPSSDDVLERWLSLFSDRKPQ